MKASSALSLATLFASVYAVSDADAAELSAILSDISANRSDYLGEIANGNAPPSALLSLVQKVLTYTDDSYTTLYDDVDMGEVNSYITGLPWYSTRLSAAIASATAGAGGSEETSAAESSAAEETTAAESTAAETTVAESTAAETTVAESTTAAASSEGSSSVVAVSTYEGSGNALAAGSALAAVGAAVALII